LTAVLALSVSPAFAQPEGTPDQTSNPGTQHQRSDTPTAENTPGTARKLAAPGRYCKAASKKRVEGQKGTAFSACVKAQARLRSGKADSPREACKGASKKHVEGEKGTAFSTCVKAGAKLLKDQKAQEKAAEAPTEG
jgi:hypothetical protein